MKKSIIVDGMDNLPMGSAVSRILEGVDGMEKVTLNLEETFVIVEYGRGVFAEDELCDAINEEGFEVIDIFEES